MYIEQALKYPDADEWSRAHDVELDRTDDTCKNHWLDPDFRRSTRPLPITMGYLYYWTTDFKLIKTQKTRGATRRLDGSIRAL